MKIILIFREQDQKNETVKMYIICGKDVSKIKNTKNKQQKHKKGVKKRKKHKIKNTYR